MTEIETSKIEGIGFRYLMSCAKTRFLLDGERLNWDMGNLCVLVEIFNLILALQTVEGFFVIKEKEARVIQFKRPKKE